jgi:hypothetical protein
MYLPTYRSMCCVEKNLNMFCAEKKYFSNMTEVAIIASSIMQAVCWLVDIRTN